MGKKTFFQQIKDVINDSDDNEDNISQNYKFEKVVYNGEKTRIGSPINFDTGQEFQIVGHFEEMINGSKRTFYILSDPVTKIILDGEFDSFCFDVKPDDNTSDEIKTDNPTDETPNNNIDNNDDDEETEENNNLDENYRPSSSKAAYGFWFLFYFLLFWAILFVFTRSAGISLLIIAVIYGITIIFAFSNPAEKLWRAVNNVRPSRIRAEKLRLLPLFKEVYVEAVKQDKDLSRGIKLYIQENMTINAFAFGRKTLVLTRGCAEMLSEEKIKGIMAHELGHFAHSDTVAVLVMAVGNIFVSLFMQMLSGIKNRLDKWAEKSFIIGIIKFFYDIIFYIFKGIQSISELLLMHTSRKNEYLADLFALDCGFGENITEALIELYKISGTEKQKIKKLISSSHPPLTKRIENLEKILYSDK